MWTWNAWTQHCICIHISKNWRSRAFPRIICTTVEILITSCVESAFANHLNCVLMCVCDSYVRWLWANPTNLMVFRSKHTSSHVRIDKIHHDLPDDVSWTAVDANTIHQFVIVVEICAVHFCAKPCVCAYVPLSYMTKDEPEIDKPIEAQTTKHAIELILFTRSARDMWYNFLALKLLLYKYLSESSWYVYTYYNTKQPIKPTQTTY